MTELEKLQQRFEAIRAYGGDMAFTLGHDPGSLEEVAALANAMLDYVPPKHDYWRPGEADCPREIKAGNGALHTLRCRRCGLDDPRDSSCRPHNLGHEGSEP